MKRVLALLLALAMATTSALMLAGCANGKNEEDLGAEVRSFFVGEVYDFDPAKAYTNDDAMKVLSLIYEPLFELDSNGNLQYGLASSYRFYEDRGHYKLDVTLRDTCWNDGEPVTAAEVVYAWKRILAVDFPCQAATLLYEIKNARAAKMGDVSQDDVAISDQGKVLTIEFEEELTPEGQQNFLRNLTSVALTPMRDQVIEKAGREDIWTKRVAYIVTNGPFAIRALDYSSKDTDLVEDGHEFRLERNNYYHRPKVEGGLSSIGNKSTHVTPFKFLSYWNTSLDETFEQFMEGTIFYAGDIPLEKRAEYLSRAHVNNLLSTYTYALDNTDPVLADARVRRAMSLVLDRALIASDATGGLGIAATGFVSHGVLNGASGSFSAVTAGSDYALAKDVEKAVSLVKEAKDDGYSGGEINMLIRKNEEEKAIAELAIEAWKALFRDAGVRVTINLTEKSYTSFSYKENPEDKQSITLYNDTVQEAYRVSDDDTKPGFGGYNVLGIDYQMLSPDAFAVLASFSTSLCGNGVHMGGINPEDTFVRAHVTGFTNADYDKLINDAYAEKDLAERSRILHEAEKKLLDEMPVIPVLFNRSAALVSADLSRVYHNYYGYTVFTRTELRNYHKHLIEAKVVSND